MDIAQIARRFPLVARPRPPCLPLAERVRQIGDLARAAESDGNQALAAAAQNKAALIASDCGLPDLASSLCWRHFETYLSGRPLDPAVARHALEPLVNLARLLIREGDGDGAYRLLGTLFHAVTARTDTELDGRYVSFRNFTTPGEDHRTLCQWLWTVLLADGTRALASAGRWEEALTHAERHKGVGRRLLDGRQVAVLAHLHADDPATAFTLLQDSTPAEPWEQTVTACLTVLCLSATARPVDSALTTMVNNYLRLHTAPGLAVFHARLGMTVIDLAEAAERRPDAAPAATRLLQEAVANGDGYVARDILAHHLCRTQLLTTEQNTLSNRVQLSGLHRGTIPDHLMADLLAAVKASETVTARHRLLRAMQ
ncbi:hypothetical protein ABZ801_11985 [Actinomadura sp. NPDC047616]|uniref:hypothetical protein n=1 Tax=Actinomadura sp. NPDC047616 TaxID=3155914 RepID=UPI0033F7F9C6